MGVREQAESLGNNGSPDAMLHYKIDKLSEQMVALHEVLTHMCTAFEQLVEMNRQRDESG